MAVSDWITEAEARDLLGLTSAQVDSTALARVVTALSDRLDALTGPAVRVTIEDEVHDGGSHVIWVDHPPIVSVSSLKERANGVQTSLTVENYLATTANDFAFDSERGRLWRRSNGYDRAFASGRRNIIVTYEAGRWADTAAVSPRFKEAAGIVLRHLWQPRTFGRMAAETGEMFLAPGWAVPKQALDMLHSDLIPQGM